MRLLVETHNFKAYHWVTWKKNKVHFVFKHGAYMPKVKDKSNRKDTSIHDLLSYLKEKIHADYWFSLGHKASWLWSLIKYK